MRINIDKDSIRFLLLMILIDLVFIFCHIFFNYTAVISDPLMSLKQDRGYAEIYQYIKEFWLVILIIILAFRFASVHLISWGLLFFYFLVDDSFRLHERLGSFIVESLNFTGKFGIRGQDLGELSVSAISGVIIFSLIGISYLKSHSEIKKIARYLLCLTALLLSFGIVLDVIDSNLKSEYLKDILDIVEDSGEMISMSLLVWYVFAVSSNKEHDPDFLAKYIG